MLQFEVLILKLLAIYGPAPRAITSGEVPSLQHEVLDHPVELAALVTLSLLLVLILFSDLSLQSPNFINSLPQGCIF